MGRLKVTLLVAASALASLASAYCPDADSLRPCTCDDEGINCMRALSTAQLRTAFRSGDALTREHKELWIQKTPVTSFPAGLLGNFKFERVHVELNANLSHFTVDALANFRNLLTVLSLYGNALETFEFNKLQRFPHLVMLNVGGNRLTRVPANAFRHIELQKIALTRNPITSIGARAFYGLPSLRELDLSGTRLATLGANSLSILRGRPDLRIDLSSAGIRNIHPTAFDSAAPYVLNLSNNSLTTLEQNPFEHLMVRMYQNARTLRSLPLINIIGNPLTCRGCSYRWLINYRYSPQVRSTLHGFRCPDGYGLTSISAQRIGCQDSWNFMNIG